MPEKDQTELEYLREAVRLRQRRLDALGGISDAVVKNAEWQYMLRADARNSLSIEGHFATDAELERIITGSKSAPEIYNYFRAAQSAYDLALQQRRARDPVILGAAYIRHTHSELFRGTHGNEARGRFRIAPTTIQGARVKPPDRDVDEYIGALTILVKSELAASDQILGLARLHALFEGIHPFADGNGRTGRILLNYLAVWCGYGPIVIKGLEQKDRDVYYSALQTADRGFHDGFPAPNAGDLRERLDTGNFEPLETLLLTGARKSLDYAIALVVGDKTPLVDLRTMAAQEKVSEATLRKRIERNQLVAIRRGKRLVSSPNLYLRAEEPALPATEGPPSDALTPRKALLAFQPRLHIEMRNPPSVDGRFRIGWEVKNIGAGAASRIRVFLPGIITDVLEAPLEPGGVPAVRGTLFEDKPAFQEWLPVYARTIAEFEDQSGNVYRQYARVEQGRVPSGAYLTYRVEELERPYLVEGRIVQ